jgi:hypothetical protein
MNQITYRIIQQTLRRILILATLALLSATLALAQSPALWSSWPPSAPRSNTFRGAIAIGPSHGKLYVVTIAHPKQEQTCRIQSFKQDQLVCLGNHGHTPVVYRAQDIAALITPGLHSGILATFLGFVGAGAGAITGAVFLASISMIGAVAVAAAGGFLLLFSTYLAMGADSYDSDIVLYLAPSQTLQVKLRS